MSTRPQVIFANFLLVSTLVVSCSDSDSTPSTSDVDSVSFLDDYSDTDGADFTKRTDAPELSGPKVDIEGLALDDDAQCVDTEVVTLGQGLLEPPIFAPRCLVNEASGVRYLTRPGSRAIPPGYSTCELGGAFVWRMCGQPACPDSYQDAQASLSYGCTAVTATPQCAEFSLPDVATSYWNPITHVWVISHNYETSSSPWIEGGPDFPSFLDGYERRGEPCPER